MWNGDCLKNIAFWSIVEDCVSLSSTSHLALQTFDENFFEERLGQERPLFRQAKLELYPRWLYPTCSWKAFCKFVFPSFAFCFFSCLIGSLFSSLISSFRFLFLFFDLFFFHFAFLFFRFFSIKILTFKGNALFSGRLFRRGTWTFNSGPMNDGCCFEGMTVTFNEEGKIRVKWDDCDEYSTRVKEWAGTLSKVEEDCFYADGVLVRGFRNSEQRQLKFSNFTYRTTVSYGCGVDQNNKALTMNVSGELQGIVSLVPPPKTIQPPVESVYSPVPKYRSNFFITAPVTRK